MTTPGWIRQLVESVSKVTMAISDETELGCHVYRNQSGEIDEWEITLFGDPSTLGGRLASYAIDPVLSVDALALAMIFDTILSCRWQSGKINSQDDLGPHLSVEGILNGESVWLRIVGKKPRGISGDSFTSSRLRHT